MVSKSTIYKGITSAVLVAFVVAGTPAFAKEVTSGGATGGVVAACNPVSSLTTKCDPRVGETGLASIDVTYSVKSCDKNAVTASVEVYQNGTNEQVYLDPAAPLNGKFTVFGIKVRTSYIVKVTVYDAVTGAVVGVRTAFAAAVPKGV